MLREDKLSIAVMLGGVAIAIVGIALAARVNLAFFAWVVGGLVIMHTSEDIANRLCYYVDAMAVYFKRRPKA